MLTHSPPPCTLSGRVFLCCSFACWLALSNHAHSERHFFLENSQEKDASTIIADIRLLGFEPNLDTYNILLKVCSRGCCLLSPAVLHLPPPCFDLSHSLTLSLSLTLSHSILYLYLSCIAIYLCVVQPCCALSPSVQLSFSTMRSVSWTYPDV
jgi:hypothetical protein